MKKITIFLLIIFFTPLQVFAAIGGGGGGSNYCVNNSYRDTSNVFENYESQEYINGFLQINFKLQDSNNYSDVLYPFVDLYNSDCNHVGGDYYDWSNPPTLVFPPHLTNFSLRFTSQTHFYIWNTDSAEPFDCPMCDVDFNSYSYPENLSASFFVGDYLGNNYIGSKSYPIVDPNNNVKTPILVIPGIMGSEIKKGSDTLWADIPRMINPLKSDSFMDPLSFKLDGTALDTSLEIGDIIREPYPGQHFYDGIIQELTSQGYEENKDLFVFPYDWRQDLAKTAFNQAQQNLDFKDRTDLAGKIEYILQKTNSSKLDVIAHSQGGLVVKSLIFNKEEFKNKIRKLVFVGTPHFGAPQAAKILLFGDNLDILFKRNGFKIGQLDPDEVKKIAQNMPAVYELLPSQSYFLNQPLGYLYNHLNLYLNTDVLTNKFLNDRGLNSDLIDLSKNFHNYNLDNLDFSNSGLEVYNIAGCEQATPGTLVFKSDPDKPEMWFTAGDGTVPLNSSKNVLGASNYYIKGGMEHSKMLSTTTVETLVKNIINSVNSNIPNVVTDKTECSFNGTQITIHSPVEVDVFDENGAHVGISQDEQNPFTDLGVSGSQYEEIGHNKFVFLPSDHNYSVKLKATDSGVFNLSLSEIKEGDIIKTVNYINVPVATTSLADLSFNNQMLNTSISLDSDGNGSVDKTILPSSLLNQEQSKDVTPPISTTTLQGLTGREGYFRSNVTVNISSVDPVIAGHEEETSGVLNLNYQVDNQAWQQITATSTYNFSMEGEGSHTLSFYATDKAGNSEQIQTINFTVDKTAPEFNIQFDPSLKDLKFTGQDNISTTSQVTVLDEDNKVSITDEAGNISQLTLKDKNRRKSMKAEIKSLSYNSQPVDINKLVLNFEWQTDKNNKLKSLTQELKSKKDFNIEAEYENNKTKLEGKDRTGKIKQTLPGLVLLKLTTKQGDFEWGW